MVFVFVVHRLELADAQGDLHEVARPRMRGLVEIEDAAPIDLDAAALRQGFRHDARAIVDELEKLGQLIAQIGGADRTVEIDRPPGEVRAADRIDGAGPNELADRDDGEVIAAPGGQWKL